MMASLFTFFFPQHYMPLHPSKPAKIVMMHSVPGFSSHKLLSFTRGCTTLKLLCEKEKTFFPTRKEYVLYFKYLPTIEQIGN